ncbi:hypothetical protein ACMBCM_09540, partial [Spiroplasma sp. K1]
MVLIQIFEWYKSNYTTGTHWVQNIYIYIYIYIFEGYFKNLKILLLSFSVRDLVFKKKYENFMHEKE